MEIFLNILVPIIIFVVTLLFILFILFIITKKSKNKYVSGVSQTLLFSIIVLTIIELMYRVFLGIYYKEYRFITYPLKMETYTYLRLIWPKEVAKKDVLSTTIEYQGLHYFKANEINNFRVQDKRNSSKNKKTIVCLGGSSTWGHNSDDKTYPYFLKSNLKSFNIYNYGQRAHRSSNFVDNMQKSGLYKNNIDYVILYIGHNDSMSLQYIYKAYEVVQKDFEKITNNTPIKYSMLFRDLSVFLYGNYAAEVIKKLLLKKLPYPNIKLKDNNNYFIEHISKLIIDLKNNNKDIKIFFIQELTNYNKIVDSLVKNEILGEMEIYKIIDNDFKGKFKIMNQLASQDKNIYFYMSNEILSDRNVSDIMLDVVHLKDLGNKVLAEFIAKKIKIIEDDKNEIKED